MEKIILSTNPEDLLFFLGFLAMWFGRNVRLSEISEKEFEKAYKCCAKKTRLKENIDK